MPRLRNTSALSTYRKHQKVGNRTKGQLALEFLVHYSSGLKLPGFLLVNPSGRPKHSNALSPTQPCHYTRPEHLFCLQETSPAPLPQNPKHETYKNYIPPKPNRRNREYLGCAGLSVTLNIFQVSTLDMFLQ